MAIKPVDFQVMIPKTPEVSKMQSDEHQKDLVTQQQQMATTQQKTEDSIKHVHSQDKAQNAKIKEKQEKDKGNKKDKNKKDDQKKSKSNQTSTIDIRL